MFPFIPAHPFPFVFGHMIQSKHPVLAGFPDAFKPIIDHCNVPFETILMVIKVELVSPDNKHPELTPCGLELGLEIVPVPKSTTFVAGFGGSIAKSGVEQPDTAPEQLFD
ncbi:hypothetical protein D3C86_1490680 [compost metagenome]